MWYAMGDECIVIDMLLLVGNDASVALALGSLARESEVQTVAGDAVVQGNDVVVDAAIGLLVNIYIADANILIVCLLQAVEVEGGVLSHVGLDDLRGQEVAVVGSMVAEEHLELGSFLKYDEHTAIDHEVDVRA